MQLATANPVRLVALVGMIGRARGRRLRGEDHHRRREQHPSSSQPKLLHASVGHRLHRTTPSHTTRKPGRPHARPARAVAANGLPRAVADALVRNPVVVVSVVAPRGAVDDVAVREAQAGAAAAHAGFVRVDAFRQSQIAPLQAKLGIKDDPALIVLRRPVTVSFEVSGFVDRATVVQAVADARAAAAAAS